MFFNEQGLLRLDEVVANNHSWQKIMEDGVVTDEELKAQADEVTSLLHTIEDSFNDEQKELVESLLASISVLFAAHNVYSIQQIAKD